LQVHAELARTVYVKPLRAASSIAACNDGNGWVEALRTLPSRER